MPKFVAVHTLAMTKEQAIAMASDPNFKLPPGFAWKQTYCDFGGQKFFCDWEAPSKEALAQVFNSLKMPFDAIYPVELFDVASKKFTK